MENQYPTEVRAYRSNAAFQQVALLVGTEADEKAVQDRFARLASKLTHTKLSDRTATERIVIWVPKWNVETWILHLSGEQVDEAANYKHRIKDPDFRVVAAVFVDRFRKSRHGVAEALPSLQVAFEETSRLIP